MDDRASDRGVSALEAIVQALMWCRDCERRTLHLSDGLEGGHVGNGHEREWACRSCGCVTFRMVGAPAVSDQVPRRLVGPDGRMWYDQFLEIHALDRRVWAGHALAALLVFGPISVRIIRVVTAWLGLSMSTMRKAKKALGVQSKRLGGHWFWVPPW